MNLKTLVLRLRSIPDRFEHIEEGIRQVVDRMTDLNGVIERLLSRSVPKPEPTYVYLLLPNSRPMYCQRQYVERGSSMQISFTTYTPEPAGVWVVTIGPAIVRGVRIGNQMQSGMNDYQGHVCKTVDPWEIGQHLTVELAA